MEDDQSGILRKTYSFAVDSQPVYEIVILEVLRPPTLLFTWPSAVVLAARIITHPEV
jgi:hypothetical protein